MELARDGQRKSRASQKASHVRGIGATPKPASKRRRVWWRQCRRRCSTASTGNLHDCGVSLKRPRGSRTKGRGSSASWPRWQAMLGAGMDPIQDIGGIVDRRLSPASCTEYPSYKCLCRRSESAGYFPCQRPLSQRCQDVLGPRENLGCNLAFCRGGVFRHLSGMSCPNDRRGHLLPSQHKGKCKLG